MPRPYPPEFRARAIALVREGRQVKQTALDLGIHEVTLHNWLRQDDIDLGRRPGLSSQESAELRAARGRVRQLEQEIAILRRAATWLDEEGGVGPKRAHPVIDRLVDAGAPTSTCCRLLGVSRQGYYRYRKRPTSATELRRRWLTGLIREIHVASRGTYGYRRIHAELTIGMNIPCSSRLISVLMTRAGIGGLPGPARIKRLKGVATADDLVNRKFHRLALNELWVTDITEHPTREGKIYCAAVLDACSRKIIGWAIDSKQDSTLVVNALDMAIRARQPGPGGIVHADHGVQFTSWVFTQKIRSAGLLPSFGTVGDGLDNAMMESFWSTMQIELLNRKKWKTRIELANAIFEYIEVFYNRRRRHSSLEYATPHDYDLARTPRALTTIGS
ncbi:MULTISPECIES: IS3-like element ISAar24 family transposase [Micrococcales]|uniref:IS3-like element ISAar24 family transposase n=1 Tax=Brevibacterium aurantiacum TaxID=273384 RepID=A0A3T0DPH4_BREAU|nr:IS3-like element ISAar24 family transposase [Brevibacterium aurantiacum]AZT96958.1 IS3-like element ISAar24 family transposase [Brevibacterium aurantiacum]RCT00027.1 IS3-like element ISAar24 family transposase [Brevibacterium aurantiacum]